MTEPCNPHSPQQPSSLEPGAVRNSAILAEKCCRIWLVAAKNWHFEHYSLHKQKTGMCHLCLPLECLKISLRQFKKVQKNVIRSCQPTVNSSGSRFEGGCEELRFVSVSSLCCLSVAITLSNRTCLDLQGSCA